MSGELVETIMEDGDWVVRRQAEEGISKNTPIGKLWISHISCWHAPRRVRDGKCHNCSAVAPAKILGFLDLVRWER